MFPARYDQARVLQLITFYLTERVKNASQLIEMVLTSWIGYCFV